MEGLPGDGGQADFDEYLMFDYMDVEGEGEMNPLPELQPASSRAETLEIDPRDPLEDQSVQMLQCKNSICNHEGQNVDDESLCDETGIIKTGGVHPLLLPDVIKDVMNHLSAKDIETCRLVCRSWNNEACKVLRNKRIVVFVDADAIRVYNNAMRDTVDFPHAQFEFCIQDFTGLMDGNLRDFWTIFGPHIRVLEFRQPHIFWRDFYEVMEQRVPNLEKLILRHLPRHIRGRNPTNQRHILPTIKELRLASLPSSATGTIERLSDLLKSLPNLEIIEFLPIKQAVVQTKVCNALIEILRKPEVALQNLKRINLNLELTTDGLEALTLKQFPFQCLHMTLAPGVKATSLKDLLLSLRPNLTELKISFPDTYSNYQTFLSMNDLMKPEETVQVLTNLKSLSMINFKGSIKFVQRMPVLNKLEFTTSNVAQSVPFGFRQRTPAFRTRSFPSVEHNLKSLKITSSSPNSISETLTLEGISRCFPYLNCLQLHGVDDDGLGIIYRNLPFLSHVNLVEAKCTDQGLTGIPIEICNDMIETSTFIVVQADRYRRDLFIGSLQFLRTFSITAAKISDASIALGLVDCKNLKELTIGSPKITDTGVIFITDKFFKQLDYLDVSECTEITEQSKFYAGEKLMGKLKVDETQEVQAQAKAVVKPHVSNPDRGIVKVKRTSVSPVPFGLTSTHSKYVSQDVEFFEEHSDEELRERGIGFLAPGPGPFQLHNRQRVVRIREALRQNGDFMRNLQRLDIQHFRRLFHHELREGMRFRPGLPEGDLERHLAFARLRRRNVDIFEAIPNGEIFRHMQGQARFQQDLELGENNANRNEQPPLPEPAPALNPVEDDGAPLVGEIGPDRLPEFHLNEIVRLGLRLDDVEFWLRNHQIFEGDGNVNPVAMLARGLHADVLLDGVHFHEEANVGPVGAENLFAEEDDIDLEAFRRVVLNVFDDDMRLHDMELPFVAQPPDEN